jgi:hypothetical protein
MAVKKGSTLNMSNRDTVRADESPAEVAELVRQAGVDNVPHISVHERGQEIAVFHRHIVSVEAPRTGTTQFD